MSAAFSPTFPRKPQASAQRIDSRRIGKYDRRLIIRYFTNAPKGVEPSAYAHERMECRFTEAEIDSVMVEHVDLLTRLVAGWRVHAAGFTSMLREIEHDTMDDLATA